MSDQNIHARRRPVQARSRARYDAILEAASDLFIERGLNPVTMTDIAERAGMALTAVYRYFPNKQSIIRELAVQTFASDARVSGMPPQQEGQSIQALVRARVIALWQTHQANPLHRQLRNVIHADHELEALDLAESQANAAHLAAVVAQTLDVPPSDELRQVALLTIELADGLVRILARTPDSRMQDQLIEHFVTAVVAMVEACASSTAAPG